MPASLEPADTSSGGNPKKTTVIVTTLADDGALLGVRAASNLAVVLI